LNIAAMQHLDLAAEPAREREGLVELALPRRVHRAAGLHRDHRPWRIAAFSQPARDPHQVLGLAAAVDRDQHPPPQRHPRQAARRMGLAQVAVHPVRGGLHRKLAQCGQVGGREERLQRVRRLLRHVDLALLQSLDQFARRQVHQLDVAQAVEHAVGHGLAHAHAGDPVDHVVEAFQVLDVDRGADVDAGVEQFDHVLPAAFVAAAGRVAVRQFVHQRQPGPAREQGVEVEFLQRAALVFDALARQDFEPFDQPQRLAATVGFHQPHDHVHALPL
jgi:hypothetical protein